MTLHVAAGHAAEHGDGDPDEVTIAAPPDGATAVVARGVLALGMVSLLRVLELSVPFDDTHGPAPLAMVAGPLVIAVLLMWRSGAVTTPPRAPLGRLDAALVAVSLPVAGVLFVVLDPAPVGTGSGMGIAAAAGAVALAAGARELIFRGVVQASLSEIWGGWAVAFAAGLSAISPVGPREPEMAVVACGLGLLTGVVVRRTGSIVGAIAAHAVVAVLLLVVFPAAA